MKKILDQYDEQYKSIKEYVERNSGEALTSSVKDLKVQTMWGESGDLFAFSAISSDQVFDEAVNISALRASNINPEENSFDSIRLSDDEKDIILSRSIKRTTGQLINFLSAYAKTLHTPLQITSLLEDKNNDNVADEGEEVEEHCIFLLRFPSSWPAYKIADLSNIIEEILTSGILLEYWKQKDFLQFAEVEQITIDNLFIDLKSVISKRVKPYRRKASFFH